MADPTHRESRRFGRAWRRRFMFGGFVGAFFAFLILLLRKLLILRSPNTATQPVVASTEAHQREHPRTAFEPTDWKLAPVAVIYIGILVLLVISCFVLIAAYPNALPDVGRTLNINPPGPRLQTDPEADLRRFRAEEDKRLNGYYWIDKHKGIAHIPIEQAMQKLAGAGIPGFPKTQQ